MVFAYYLLLLWDTLFPVPSPESFLVQSLNEVDKAIIKVLTKKNWIVS